MLKFHVPREQIDKILNECQGEYDKVKKQIYKSLGDLAIAAKEHIKERAKEDLSSNLFKIFNKDKQGNENIRVDMIDESCYVVTLTGTAYWIEEGIGPNTPMATDQWLFKSSKTKTAKDGSKYLFVPFEHSAAPSTQTDYQKGLSDRIKFQLKAQNKIRKVTGLPPIPWKSIEYDRSGKPREGFLHEFDFQAGKAKPSWTSDPLERVRVYQQVEKDKSGIPLKTKGGKVKVSRSFMTFRTASSKHSDKWVHPGYTAKKFMDETEKWVEKHFYEKIVPEIFAKWKDE